MKRRGFAATLCGLWLSVASCGDQHAPAPHGSESSVDLLARDPDALIQQPGSRTPTLEAGWGADREYGWVRWGEKRGGQPFVWSRQRKAYLALECISPRDRTLVLRAWKPKGAPEDFVATVSLNGLEVGSMTLSERPAVHTIETPAAAWRAGRNRLAVSVPETVRQEGGQEIGFALGALHYDDERRVVADRKRRRLRLAGETAAHYAIELLSPTQLYMAGKASGECSLELRVYGIDANSGVRTEELTSQSIRMQDDALQRALDLPSLSGRLEIELALKGDAASHFDFERLELRETVPSERFPIIFISIDTLSAQHLSAYGYERPTSPQLERFAADAIVFENCMSNTTWTLPSYMSQMTGLFPYSHRLYPGRQAEMWELWHLSDNRWTLAELLRSAGWATGGFVDNDWITERFGLAQGFDHFDASAAALPIDDPEGGIQHVTRLARNWLDELGPAEPFFLFLHAFDVHGPYIADSSHRGTFCKQLDLSHRAPAGGGVAFGIIPSYVAETLTPEVIPPTLPTEPLKAAYDEVIRMVDTELGRFFEHLRTVALYERSLIIVSADHGETMANSSMLFGHGVLDQDVLHIPLLVKLPDSARGGSRVIEPVQLVDLYPTILEMIGREPTASLHGASLVPLLQGHEAPRRPLLSEGGAMQQAALFEGRWKLVEKRLGRDSTHSILISAPHQTLEWARKKRESMLASGSRSGLFRWMDDKLLSTTFFFERYRTGLTEELHQRMQSSPEYARMIRFLRKANDTPVYELYDLEADPRCAKDLAGSRPEIVAKLRVLLREQQARRDEAQKLALPPQAPPALGTIELERLRALGYLGE